VQFSRGLTAGALTGPPWTMQATGKKRKGLVVNAAGDTVSGSTALNLTGPPPDTISYNAATGDLLDDLGRAVPSFTAYPLTVV
jgi:hypothetical protein